MPYIPRSDYGALQFGIRGARLATVRSAEWTRPPSAGEHQRALDLLDRLGHLDAPRAGVGAVERGAAAPYAVDLVEDVEPLGRGLVTAVEDEAVCVDDGRRTEVATLIPEHRAAGGARSAQDALGGVVVAGAVGLALNAFPGRGIATGDQVWLDRAIGVEERLHVDDQVLLHRQSADRLDRDGQPFCGFVRRGLAGQQIAHQHLAGQSVDAVDPHRVGATHAVRAGPPEGQRAVQIALDVDQQIEHTVGRQARYPEALPAAGIRVLVRVFRIEPSDSQGNHHRAHWDGGQRRALRVTGRGGLANLVFRQRAHQYFRSLGS